MPFGVEPENIGIYIDYMLVFRDDPFEHMEVLTEVFHRHRELVLLPISAHSTIPHFEIF